MILYKKLSQIFFYLLVIGLIYLSRFYSYLLFHIIVELFSIIVAVTIFILAWNSQKYIKNQLFLFLGIASLAVGFVDLLHTLTFKGMNIITGYGANLPTQLWICARYLQSITFLIAPIFIRKNFHSKVVLTIYGLVTAGLIYLVLASYFPACYIEGSGLTSFKIISEYIISLLLIISIVMLFNRRSYLNPQIFRLLIFALGATIFSELAFTFYVGVNDILNLLGHFFKLLSFYLIYLAIIRTGIREPFELIFKELNEKTELWEKVFHSGPMLMTITDLDTDRYLEVNKSFCQISGYSREEVLGITAVNLGWFIPQDYENFKKEIYNEQKLAPLEFKQRKKSGEIVTCLYFYEIINISGKKRLLSIASDITVNKKAAEILMHELKIKSALSNLYELFITSAPEIAEIARVLLDYSLRITDSKQGFVSRIDPETGENVSYNLAGTVFNKDSADKEEQLITFPRAVDGTYSGLWGHALNTREAFFTNEPQSHPAYLADSSLNISALENLLTVPVILKDKLVGQITLSNSTHDYTSIDIESIKRIAEYYALVIQRFEMEKEILRARDFYMKVLQDAPVLIWRSDRDSNCDWFNKRWLSFTGRTMDQELDNGWTEGVHPDDLPTCLNIYLSAFAVREPFFMEYRLRDHTGNYRWIMDAGQPLWDLENNFTGFIGYCFDITERRTAEQSIKEALEEKEILLREIHHRVKNNLNTISNILYFQSKTLRYPECIHAYQESQNRIQTMARIHEHLYRSRNLALIDMNMYIAELLNDLGQIYNEQGINIFSEATNISLDIDRAVPCGLLINELASNALKFAFKGKCENKKLFVKITVENDKYHIIIHDTGIGLPDNLNMNNLTSLGLKLVKMLVTQLRGYLTIESEKGAGTLFKISFAL